MPKYEIKDTTFGKQITRTDDDGTVWYFADDLANPDYQAYLASLDEASTL